MLLSDSQERTAPSEGRPVDYWLETRRPFCNLIFLFPLLVVYEAGVLLTGGFDGNSIRNGADAWMRHWLLRAGIDLFWLLPLLLLSVLLAWHLTVRQPWRMKWETLGGMMAESLLYAFVLIMLGQLTDYGFRYASSLTVQPDLQQLQLEDDYVANGFLIRLVTYMGAGIYEEFLFRLCLLPALYGAIRLLMIPRHWALLGTVVISSVVFSLAHYLGPSTDGSLLQLVIDAIGRVKSRPELWFGFVFRTLAGIFFAGLYFFRGFGIAVGAHAAYDVFVGIVLINEL
ncbi:MULTISPECIES: CPBP family intramembrane glutamic endopeptidase [unclassified Schlesneria]|uniref:CPBP family intramembrane glutamic endopeptidase n=1 Tax=Schlesneria TaxID=656899 RepID=UPI0035A0E82A